MQLGEYCVVVTLQSRPMLGGGVITSTHQFSYTVQEVRTRIELTSLVIELSIGSANEKLAQTGRSIDTFGQPLVLFLSIEPN